MEIDRGYHVVIKVAPHPDTFHCVPSEGTRKALSRLFEVENGSVGSVLSVGMSLEEAKRIADEQTDREGYTTQAYGDMKFVSRGIVKPNKPWD